MYVKEHFLTITKHRHTVMALCFKIGLYKQGLLHDLSKYSYTEFSRGCTYYQGNRSPNNYEREVNGYSLSWLHHKGRNKHHYEYWLDYDENNPGHVKGMPMPRIYVAEMFCDRVAACKTYQKMKYTQESPVRFFYRGSGKYLMHPNVRREIGFLLTMLAEDGEPRTLQYIREIYLNDAPIPSEYEEFKTLRNFDEAHGIDTNNRQDGPNEAYMIREEEALKKMNDEAENESDSFMAESEYEFDASETFDDENDET